VSLTPAAPPWNPTVDPSALASVTFPAQIHDVKAAIRALRARAAELNLDPARLGVWGSSAGGHFAALAGTSGGIAALEDTVGGNLQHSSRVQAVVDYYGPTELLQLTPDVTTPPGSIVDHDGPGAPSSLLIGYSLAGQGIANLRGNASKPRTPFPTYLALAREASPPSFIDGRDPPTLIVHTTADNQVAIRQSERLRDALALAGAWYEPMTSGQGAEIQWLEGEVLLVWFYGHRDSGANLFLLGTRTGRSQYGEPMAIPLTSVSGGRYINFDATSIVREAWGILTLTIERCDRARAVLMGRDGNKTLALEPLARAATARCD
jgi:hypothetical protein